jgi:hypothetical protein
VINADILQKVSLKRKNELEKFGILNAQNVAALYTLLVENSIMQNVMTIHTLTSRIGKEIKNVCPRWYKDGGSFCSTCHLGFTFIETYALLLVCESNNMTHGLPRCIYCGKSLRTRSKSDYTSGFWNTLK